MAKPAIAIFGAAPLDFQGGGEFSARQMAEHWAGQGYPVTYITESEAGGTVRPPSSPGAAAAGFAVRNLPFRRRRSLPGGIAVDQALPPPEAFATQPVNLLMLFRVPPPDYLAQLATLPTAIVLLFHGISVESGTHPDPRVVLYRWHQRRRLGKGAAALAARNIYIQVLTERTAAYLRELGVPPRKVFLIPTGIDTSAYRVEDAAAPFQVLFVGRLEKLQKGTHRLLRILRKAERSGRGTLRFVVAGRGAELEALRRGTRGLDQVEIRGFVPEAEKRELLARSHLFLVTSNVEPYSISAVEGLASGLPVVATPAAGPEFLLGQDPLFGRLGSFAPAELLRLIEEYRLRWSTDPAAYLAERRARRTRAVALFDREGMFTKFDALIEEVMGGPTSG
ncbi:MAG TPA: glycosyltransferase family 4 protein [Thermoplasmata archaeon]|nr:glycosyltransferase family 4 protein [Thermoplasmata archaeon]